MQGVLGSTVDGTTGVAFTTGDGTELDDVARVVLLEVYQEGATASMVEQGPVSRFKTHA